MPALSQRWSKAKGISRESGLGLKAVRLLPSIKTKSGAHGSKMLPTV